MEPTNPIHGVSLILGRVQPLQCLFLSDNAELSLLARIGGRIVD